MYFLRKNVQLLIVYIPIVTSVAMLMNIVGFHFDFWSIHPYNIAALPFDFGIYPVLACFMISGINKDKHSALAAVALYSVLTTLMEYGAFSTGIVSYGNNWNIGWTLISYFVAYTVIVLYRSLFNKYF
ncbi:CBO0543 family protein [Paenibacillus camerounensis]|uniref:CBO0543 family protein n=1 Tax=Paenibacillus camerounensis TaxID=1243663 RepID=UPI003CC75BD7